MGKTSKYNFTLIFSIKFISMKQLSLVAVEGFYAWASLFLDETAAFEFPEVDAQINIMGAGDASWMILNVYTSPTTGWEYVFLPEKDEDKPHVMADIFAFLRPLSFSLTRLLDWLKQADFVETDIGVAIISGRLAITRSLVQTDPEE
jgi:hypothetical protein